jgi:hypothetical protein
MNPSQKFKKTIGNGIYELCQENTKELEIRIKVKDAIM